MLLGSVSRGEFAGTHLRPGADAVEAFTLLEAQQLSDYLKNAYGIEPAAGGAVMMAAPGAGGGGAAAAEEKTAFNVILKPPPRFCAFRFLAWSISTRLITFAAIA